MQGDELTLELVAHVVEHLCIVLRIGHSVVIVDETQFHHQLASVADAERQRVFSCIEGIERCLCLGVEEESACPTLRTAQHVGVGESAAEDNHVDVFQGLATAHKVGHHHVLHVEACQIERVSHFTLTVRALLADDGSLDACALTTVGTDAILCHRACEGSGEFVLDGLVLIVLETLLRHAVEGLLGVQTIGSGVPDVAQTVDVEIAVATTFLHHHLTLVDGLTDFHKAHTCLAEQVFHLTLVGILHLNDHTGVLGKEQLHGVFLHDVVEVGFDTAFLVGESHLQKGGDETACTDVVTSQDESFLHQFLHSQEGIAEIFRILHRRHIAAHLAKTLSKGRTTEFQGVEGEVDVIECRVLVVHQHRADDLLHVAHLAA